MLKKFIALSLAVLGVLLLLQFSREAPNSKPVPGRRILSLAPNLTGILFDLGAGDQVVGVTTYCDYPEAARQVEKIGNFLVPNLEKIVTLHPDLVVAEEWGSSRTARSLRQLGLQVREFKSPRSVEEIYRLIEEVGATVGLQPEGARLVSEMKRRVEEIRARAATFPTRPRLYVEIDQPFITVGGESFTSEAIEISGARNLFDDLERGASMVSNEMIVVRDPEVIISFRETAEEVARRPGWDRIEAVRQNRIIDDLEESLLSQGNHRLVEGMEKLQRRIIQQFRF